MSTHLVRTFLRTLTSMALVGSTLATLDGCSKGDGDAAAPNPTCRAQAVQYSIASAQAAHEHHALGATQGAAAAAPGAPMAMGDQGGERPPTGAAPTGAAPNAAAPRAPMATSVPGPESPPMNMGPPTGGAPTGMARMLGQPPMASGSSADSGLPPAMGAPHVYHLGADTFFLDQASAIGLTSEQQKRLTAIKESAALAYATTQRKIDQGDQDIWALTSSEAPDIAKIEATSGEVARLTARQRLDFIRTVGEAVGVLSDAQRKAVASQGAAMPPGMVMPPAASASAMSMGDGAPMGGAKKMPKGMGRGGMPPMRMDMGGMADAGASGGMGNK